MRGRRLTSRIALRAATEVGERFALVLTMRPSKYRPGRPLRLEAKADINHLFDENDTVFHWAIKKKNKLGNQMIRQADAAEADGRIAVWHAQTAKGYRGLVTMADKLGKQHESVLKLRFVHDPN